MVSIVINTREDLEAIVGTIEHDVFMATLSGTLWRLEKDDQAGVWLAIADDSTIERFGFIRSDFPGAQPPELPDYRPVVAPVPGVVTMRQARLALLNAGLLVQVNTAVANMPGDTGEAARIEWEYARDVLRESPLVAALSSALSLTDEQLDDLFRRAVAL